MEDTQLDHAGSGHDAWVGRRELAPSAGVSPAGQGKDGGKASQGQAS